MFADLPQRLKALADSHERLASRANFKGNDKYPAHPDIALKRAYHLSVAEDLRSTAAVVEKAWREL